MKAILVINMPDRCNTCTFRTSDSENNWCFARLPRLKLGHIDGVIPRHISCPLKPLPQKLDANDYHRMFGGEYKIREAKGYGYNACIDEILGEEQ